MPHKRNPILSENLCGLARVLRGNALAALENVALWHERDISHSSVERLIAPDSTVLLDFMLARLTRLLKNLQVYPENMAANLNLTRGLVFSQSLLLALIDKGLARDAAYRLVQRPAMQVWEEGARLPMCPDRVCGGEVITMRLFERFRFSGREARTTLCP